MFIIPEVPRALSPVLLEEVWVIQDGGQWDLTWCRTPSYSVASGPSN